MTDASTCRVVFTPAGREVDVAIGTTVLDAARAAGVDLDSVCGGRGLCGRCQVVPSEGVFPKWDLTTTSASVGTADDTEINYRGARPLVDGQRLGCATHILQSAVIDIPPSSQIHRQIVRKTLDLEGVVVDPLVVLRYAEVDDAELGSDATATSLIGDALHRVHSIQIDRWRPAVLPNVHAAMANDARGVTVAIRHDHHGDAIATAVFSGFVDSAYGVAIDVGSTTIAGHLCDLATGDVVATAGRMNPQIRLGEDLMSRVSYVMMNPGGDVELTRLVREAINELLDDLLAESAVERDLVLDVVIVGNPIMCHLVLGIDPTPLGMAPFLLATGEAVDTEATAIGLNAPNADLYVGPAISGHVGADSAAAMLAEGPHRSTHPQLLVDVGTNAEIVLGTTEWSFAASSPTGPAFEGAQLSCGQRATAGAIERVRIDSDTLEPRFQVIGSELWSDDPEFAASTSKLNISGVCGSGVIEVIGELYLAGIIDAGGTIFPRDGLPSERIIADGRTYSYVLHRPESGATASGDLLITQNDVRAIQLAKAALRAGIDLLLEHAGLTSIGDVRLAGAFGAHIDPLYAMVLGMIPDCPLDGVRSVGNAAGAGAVRALVSGELRTEMQQAVRTVQRIETATEARFQELFVSGMAFPDDPAASPHLCEHVRLPEQSASERRSSSGRRQRRTRTEIQPDTPIQPDTNIDPDALEAST